MLPSDAVLNIEHYDRLAALPASDQRHSCSTPGSQPSCEPTHLVQHGFGFVINLLDDSLRSSFSGWSWEQCHELLRRQLNKFNSWFGSVQPSQGGRRVGCSQTVSSSSSTIISPFEEPLKSYSLVWRTERLYLTKIRFSRQTDHIGNGANGNQVQNDLTSSKVANLKPPCTAKCLKG